MQNNEITVPKLIEECKKYYQLPNNRVGGSLHIVLDDGNIEDSHIEYCIGYAKENGDDEGVLLGQILLKATKTQRKKLYNNSQLYCY